MRDCLPWVSRRFDTSSSATPAFSTLRAEPLSHWLGYDHPQRFEVSASTHKEEIALVRKSSEKGLRVNVNAFPVSHVCSMRLDRNDYTIRSHFLCLQVRRLYNNKLFTDSYIQVSCMQEDM